MTREEEKKEDLELLRQALYTSENVSLNWAPQELIRKAEPHLQAAIKGLREALEVLK
jgi:hypothetical protein